MAYVLHNVELSSHETFFCFVLGAKMSQNGRQNARCHQLKTTYRKDICLQTFTSIFKFANHRTKEAFVSPPNRALVDAFMLIDDVIDIFAVRDSRNRGRLHKNVQLKQGVV